MELNFTEIDTPFPKNKPFQTYFSLAKNENENENENENIPLHPRKKKIMYSDILGNMNLVVVNGKLEFAKKNVPYEEPSPSYGNYVDQQGSSHPQVPKNNIHEYELLKQQYPNLSKKEYLKQKVIDHLLYRREMTRIASIKSPKLLFTAGNSSIPPTNLPAIRNLNSLFSMKK